MHDYKINWVSGNITQLQATIRDYCTKGAWDTFAQSSKFDKTGVYEIWRVCPNGHVWAGSFENGEFSLSSLPNVPIY